MVYRRRSNASQMSAGMIGGLPGRWAGLEEGQKGKKEGVTLEEVAKTDIREVNFHPATVGKNKAGDMIAKLAILTQLTGKA